MSAEKLDGFPTTEKRTGKKCPPKIATTLMKFSIGKLQRTAFARILPNIFTLTCIRAERTCLHNPARQGHEHTEMRVQAVAPGQSGFSLRQHLRASPARQIWPQSA